MGFPIRKSTDQRVFAPPRSLSQRITSFIACACQGIHQLPLRHLIVLIANAHPRNPEGIVAWAKSCAGFDPMSLAQKDQLLEIGSRARLGKPIICKGLSVPCDKSRPFRLMKFEQIFSLRCQTEQAASQKLTTNLYTNDFFGRIISTQHLRVIRRIVANRDIPFGIARVVEPDGIEPTTSCLQSRRSPS